MNRYIFFILFSFHFSLFANVKIDTQVSPQINETGELVTFSIIISAENNPGFIQTQENTLKDWEIVQNFQSSSTQMSVAGGQFKRVSKTTINYMLKPLKTGNLTIPSFNIQVGKQQLKTSPKTVKVLQLPNGKNAQPRTFTRRKQNKNQPPNNPFQNSPFKSLLNDPFFKNRNNPFQANSDKNFKLDIMLKTQSSKKKLYKGELFELKYTIFQNTSQNTNSEILEYPSFENFLKEEIKAFSRLFFKPVELNGKQYYSHDLMKYAVIPLKTGKLKLPKLKFKTTLIGSNIFNSIFSGRGGPPPQTKSIESTDTEIEVVELPPLPEGLKFYGGIGEFKASLQKPKGPFQSNQPITFFVNFDGKGNLRLLKELEFTLPPEIQSFKSESDYKLSPSLTGYNRFKVLLLPKKAGNFTIPPLKWTYFSLKSEQYETLSIDGFELNILEGSKIDSLNSSKQSPQQQKTLIPNMPTQDLGSLHLKNNINKSTVLFFAQPWSFILYALSFLYLIFSVLRRKDTHRTKDKLKKAPWIPIEKEIKNTKADASHLNLIEKWINLRLSTDSKGHINTHSPKSDVLVYLKKSHPHKIGQITEFEKHWRSFDTLRYSSNTVKSQTIPNNLFQNMKNLLENILK